MSVSLNGVGRELLTSARTYYVSTSGSDSNDGLTVGNPFLTIQKAIDVANGIDSGGFNVIIQLANGTYSLSSSVTLKQVSGNPTVIILGDSGTPSNVVLELTGADYMAFEASNISNPYRLDGFRVDVNNATAGTSPSGVIDVARSTVQVQNLEVTASDGQNKPINWFRVEDNSNLIFTGDITIDAYTGTAPSSYKPLVVFGSSTLRLQNKTVTLTNTPDWTSGSFCEVDRGGVFFGSGNTFVGAATGSRFRVEELGFILEGTAGAGFPGDLAGTEDTATSGHIT